LVNLLAICQPDSCCDQNDIGYTDECDGLN